MYPHANRTTPDKETHADQIKKPTPNPTHADHRPPRRPPNPTRAGPKSHFACTREVVVPTWSLLPVFGGGDFARSFCPSAFKKGRITVVPINGCKGMWRFCRFDAPDEKGILRLQSCAAAQVAADSMHHISAGAQSAFVALDERFQRNWQQVFSFGNDRELTEVTEPVLAKRVRDAAAKNGDYRTEVRVLPPGHPAFSTRGLTTFGLFAKAAVEEGEFVTGSYTWGATLAEVGETPVVELAMYDFRINLNDIELVVEGNPLVTPACMINQPM